MSKFDEIVDYLNEDSYVPDMIDNLGLNLISTEVVSEGRWSLSRQYFVEWAGEHFTITDEEPATEMQEGGDFTISVEEVDFEEVTIIRPVKTKEGRSAEIDS